MADTFRTLSDTERIQGLISDAAIPSELESKIVDQYEKLTARVEIDDPEVAVRNSATAEDLSMVSPDIAIETMLTVAELEQDS
ncbi:PEP/pyruvate-binding domain-containing protein [Natronococcus wangiae]|uniref:PEP/pyruvate-binding domain-containing protein n=1 Tax=Natronococcus wangiae TaxID=3068275 RepID=UPI00273EEF6F|nr:PEP/pyruvate-binding domain-containing protein [Natronococcus sp. AD5]